MANAFSDTEGCTHLHNCLEHLKPFFAERCPEYHVPLEDMPRLRCWFGLDKERQPIQAGLSCLDCLSFRNSLADKARANVVFSDPLFTASNPGQQNTLVGATVEAVNFGTLEVTVRHAKINVVPLACLRTAQHARHEPQLLRILRRVSKPFPQAMHLRSDPRGHVDAFCVTQLARYPERLDPAICLNPARLEPEVLPVVPSVCVVNILISWGSQIIFSLGEHLTY
jgi:hypothetical protein